MGGEHTSFQLVDHLQGAIPINLLDTDEFYDLEQDPYEVTNLIDSPEHAQIRDRMHDWILEEMDRIRDPYRTFHWSKRSWRDVGNMFYMKQPFAFSNLPDGFPFQHECIHADGSYTNKGNDPFAELEM